MIYLAKDYFKSETSTIKGSLNKSHSFRIPNRSCFSLSLLTSLIFYSLDENSLTIEAIINKFEDLKRIFKFTQSRYLEAAVTLKHTLKAIKRDREVLSSLMDEDEEGPLVFQIIGPKNEALKMKDNDLLKLLDESLLAKMKFLQDRFGLESEPEFMMYSRATNFILSSIKGYFSGALRKSTKLASVVLNLLVKKSKNYKDDVSKLLGLDNYQTIEVKASAINRRKIKLERFNQCLNVMIFGLKKLIKKVSFAFYSKLFKGYQGDFERKIDILSHLTNTSLSIPLSSWVRDSVVDPGYQAYSAKPDLYRYRLIQSQVKIILESQAREAEVALCYETLLNLNHHFNKNRSAREEVDRSYEEGRYLSLTQIKAYQDTSKIDPRSEPEDDRDSEEEGLSQNNLLREDYFDQRGGYPSFVKYLQNNHCENKTIESLFPFVELEVQYRLGQQMGELKRENKERLGRLLDLEKYIDKFGYRFDASFGASVGLLKANNQNNKGLFLVELDSTGLNIIPNDFFRVYEEPHFPIIFEAKDSKSDLNSSPGNHTRRNLKLFLEKSGFRETMKEIANLILSKIRVPLFIEDSHFEDKAVTAHIEGFQNNTNEIGDFREPEIIKKDIKRLNALTKVKIIKKAEGPLKPYYFFFRDQKFGMWEILATEEGVKYRGFRQKGSTERLIPSKNTSINDF